MLRGRLTFSLITAALVTAILPGPGMSPASAAPERKVTQKHVVTWGSVPGMPASSAARHQIRRADLIVKYYDSGTVGIDANVWVKAPGQTDAEAVAGVGLLEGNECQMHHTAVSRVTRGDGSHYRVLNNDLPPSTSWNCAVVRIRARDDGRALDARVGRLTDTYVQPRLAVSSPRLLDRPKKQLRLVRGATQYHQIPVRNTGTYRARDVVVTVRGGGIAPVRRKAGTIAPGGVAHVKVPVRLKSKKKRTAVRFTASGSGVKASRVVRVRAVKAPARPASGAWRSADKSFTFKVRKGAITGFRGANLRMACRGGLYDYTTYRNVNLSFPRVKVPRHGYVEAQKKYRKGNVWYTANLRGRLVGKKMTQARFSYATAGNCRVVETFTARRR